MHLPPDLPPASLAPSPHPLTTRNEASLGCDTTATDWFLFSSAILLFTVVWWLVELPLIWRHGVKRFFQTICWHAFRIFVPGSASHCVFSHSTDSADWISLWYRGGNLGSSRSARRMGLSESLRVMLPDIFTITVAIVAVWRAGHIPEAGIGAWFIATLPAPIFGIFITVVSRMKLKNRKTARFLLTFFSSGVGIGYIVAINHTAEKSDAQTLTAMATVIYFITMIPWSAVLTCCSGFFHLFPIFVNAFARIFAFCISLQDMHDNDLFCTIKVGSTIGFLVAMQFFAWVAALMGDSWRSRWDTFGPLGSQNIELQHVQPPRPQSSRATTGEGETLQAQAPMPPAYISPPRYEEEQLPSYREAIASQRVPKNS